MQNNVSPKPVVCFCASCGSRLVVPELPAQCSHCGEPLQPVTEKMDPLYWDNPDHPLIDSRDITVREIFETLNQKVGRLVQAGIKDVTKDEVESILKAQFEEIWDIRLAMRSFTLWSPVHIGNKKQDVLLTATFKQWPLLGEKALQFEQPNSSNIVLASVKYRKTEKFVRYVEATPNEALKGKTVAQVVDMLMEDTGHQVQEYLDSMDFIESVCCRAGLTDDERKRLKDAYRFLLNKTYPGGSTATKQELRHFLTLPNR